MLGLILLPFVALGWLALVRLMGIAGEQAIGLALVLALWTVAFIVLWRELCDAVDRWYGEETDRFLLSLHEADRL
jgi:hypothetical protein